MTAPEAAPVAPPASPPSAPGGNPSPSCGVFGAVGGQETRGAAVRIGIDPGKSGAIAILWPDGRSEVSDTPVDGRDYLLGTMRATLRGVQEQAEVFGWPVCAVLEYQQAMPKQGVSTMFVCGMGFGLWQGLLAGVGIPYTLVRPAAWKKRLGLSSEKASSIALAQAKFPSLAGKLLKSKDGRAEALLLATLAGVEL